MLVPLPVCCKRISTSPLGGAEVTDNISRHCGVTAITTLLCIQRVFYPESRCRKPYRGIGQASS